MGDIGSSRRGQGAVDVRQQVGLVLDPHGQANEAVLQAGVAAGEAFAMGTRVFTLAESLGGVESLVETPPASSKLTMPPGARICRAQSACCGCSSSPG